MSSVHPKLGLSETFSRTNFFSFLIRGLLLAAVPENSELLVGNLRILRTQGTVKLTAKIFHGNNLLKSEVTIGFTPKSRESSEPEEVEKLAFSKFILSLRKGLQ